MNNQEIQIIVGILLLLVYVYCIRNNEGYKRKGHTSCQTRPVSVSGRKIYGRVKPLRKCMRGSKRGYISELKRVTAQIPRGRVPVNKGRRIFRTGTGRPSRAFAARAVYQSAKKGANYVELMNNIQGNRKQLIVTGYKGASRATKSTAQSRAMKKNLESVFILPPGRARAGRRGRRGRRGGMARFIQRCKNMFRRRKIPVGDTPRMRARRAALTPQQWAREDKL